MHIIYADRDRLFFLQSSRRRLAALHTALHCDCLYMYATTCIDLVVAVIVKYQISVIYSYVSVVCRSVPGVLIQGLEVIGVVLDGDAAEGASLLLEHVELKVLLVEKVVAVVAQRDGQVRDHGAVVLHFAPGVGQALHKDLQRRIFGVITYLHVDSV